jgi:hypothetical protein
MSYELGNMSALLGSARKRAASISDGQVTCARSRRRKEAVPTPSTADCSRRSHKTDNGSESRGTQESASLRRRLQGVAWSLDIFHAAPTAIPMGLQSFSPGLRLAKQALPWVAEPKNANPERVESIPGASVKRTIQPFQGWWQFCDFTQGSSLPRNPGLNDCHPDGMAWTGTSTSATKCPNSRARSSTSHS